MKHTRISIIVAAAALALLLAPAASLARSQNQDQGEQSKKAAKYPDATRTAPKLDLTSQKLLDELNKGLQAANSGDHTSAKAILEPIADGRKGDSKYARALAQQGLATLAFNGGDKQGAIKLLKAALANGVLPNDTYFDLTYELAQFYLGTQQYAKSLATLKKWRAEGRRETADSYALEGNIYYRLEKYDQAIAALKKAKTMAGKSKPQWNQLLAASYAESGHGDQALALAQKSLAENPKDPVTTRNAAVLLIQSGKYPQALKLYEQGIGNGSLTQAADYMNMAKVYVLIAQGQDHPEANAKKAIQTVDQGLAKGVLKPGYETYKLQGDAAYIAMQVNQAMKYYKQAEPFAKDGRLDLRRAQILMSQGKNSAAASAAHAAIKKGLDKMGEAYMVLGAAEAKRKHKGAAIAAVKKAATYPGTRSKANAWLKEAGR